MSKTMKQHYWAAVLEKDDHRCWVCAGPATEVDHLWPQRWLGDDRWSNLAAICGSCNRKKADTIPTDWFRIGHLYRVLPIGREVTLALVNRWVWVARAIDKIHPDRGAEDDLARSLFGWWMEIATPDAVERARTFLNDEYAALVATSVVDQADEARDDAEATP